MVVGDFDCINNRLKSLEGIPDKIGGDFLCDDDLNLDKKNIQKILDKFGTTKQFQVFINSIQKKSYNIIGTIHDSLSIISGWYDGDYDDSSSSKTIIKIINAFSVFRSYYSPKGETILYRSTKIKEKHIKEGKNYNIKTANKPVQHWSSSIKFARDWNRDCSEKERRVYVIISKMFKDKEILCDLEMLKNIKKDFKKQSKLTYAVFYFKEYIYIGY